MKLDNRSQLLGEHHIALDFELALKKRALSVQLARGQFTENFIGKNDRAIGLQRTLELIQMRLSYPSTLAFYERAVSVLQIGSPGLDDLSFSLDNVKSENALYFSNRFGVDSVSHFGEDSVRFQKTSNRNCQRSHLKSSQNWSS